MNPTRRQFIANSTAVVSASLGGLPIGRAFAAPEKIKIGLSQATTNHPYRVAMVEVNKRFAATNYPNVDLIVTDGNNDAKKQISDVKSLIAQDIKVLMISPLTEADLTPVVKEALDQDILVLTMDRHVNTQVTCHIGAKNLPLGIGAGKWLSEALPNGAKIIEVQGTAGASATLDRNAGFRSEIAKHAGFQVIGEQNCDYAGTKAALFIKDMLQKYKAGEFNAVFAHNDEMALAAIRVLEEAGRINDVKVVGIDGQETAFEAIKAGKLGATFVYSFCAPEGIQYAYKLATDQAVDKEVVLPSVTVTASNVDAMLGKGF